jgi:hypothetical protein
MDNNIARIDDILLSPQLTLEIAKLLLDCVFVSWNKPENILEEKTILEEKHIRKYLIVDFYQILLNKQSEYIEDLYDYSKTADAHLLLQNKIKKIAELAFILQKKDYHDEIIYVMNILS